MIVLYLVLPVARTKYLQALFFSFFFFVITVGIWITVCMTYHISHQVTCTLVTVLLLSWTPRHIGVDYCRRVQVATQITQRTHRYTVHLMDECHAASTDCALWISKMCMYSCKLKMQNSIIYRERIRCKLISSCKLYKLQYKSLDQHPRGMEDWVIL